jgi:hypothetical protein
MKKYSEGDRGRNGRCRETKAAEKPPITDERDDLLDLHVLLQRKHLKSYFCGREFLSSVASLLSV